MKKTVILAITMVLMSFSCANAQPDKLAKLETSDLPVNATEQVQNDLVLAQKILQIKEHYDPKKKDTLYLEVDVVEASLDLYHVELSGDGTPNLVFIESLPAGTAKYDNYPKGFGIITSRTLDPVWGPTAETVKLFKKHGTDLEKFRNANGAIVIPPGDKLNFMGAGKMNIRFLEPQKNAKLERNVYRIHGTLPSLEKKLGTRCSGGCTRLSNNNVRRIVKESKDSAIIVQYI